MKRIKGKRKFEERVRVESGTKRLRDYRVWNLDRTISLPFASTRLDLYNIYYALLARIYVCNLGPGLETIAPVH